MPFTILLKNDLKKSQTYVHNENDLTMEELYNVVLEKFPRFTKKTEFLLTSNSKQFDWDDSKKTNKVKSTFEITQQIATIYVLVKLPGGAL